MKVNCYKISDGPRLTPCEYSFAVEAIKQQKARVWIDILDSDTSELEEKLDDIKAEGLIRQFCLESRDHPGFYLLSQKKLVQQEELYLKPESYKKYSFIGIL
jgi:hypothetical protein